MGATAENPRKQTYQFKRGPVSRKKKWQSFVRKVKAATENSYGTLVQFFEAQTRCTSLLNNIDYPNMKKQLWAAFHLYGSAGQTSLSNTNESGTCDLFEIKAAIAGGTGTLGTVVNNYKITNTAKFNYTLGVMDLTIVNNTLPESFVNSISDMVELDVYEISYRTGYSEDMIHFGDIINSGFNDTLPINYNQYKLDLEQRGISLYDLPATIRIGKIKILKKTKYLIRAGEAVTYQVRHSKKFTMTPRQFDTNDFRHRETRTVLVVGRPVENSFPLADVKVDINCSRVYHYNVRSVETSDRITKEGPIPL